MIDMLMVYTCPNCGDILDDQVKLIESIDPENDEIYQVWVCNRCTCTVDPKFVEGQPCYRTVDHDRFLWAIGYYDDDSFGEDDGYN